jgi:6-phosphogluconolactonase
VLASLSAASVAVSRQNTFVYVGGQGGIACFSIGTGGALTATTACNLTSTGDFVSLDTSPDGQWLVGLDGVNHSINIYGINTSTGVLTLNGTATAYPLTMNSNTSVAEAVKFAPTGTYLAVALGTSGDVVYPFTTSTGVLGTTGQEIQFTASNTTSSDNALVFDSTASYLYIARLISGTGNSRVASYSISTAGIPTAVQTAASGDGPFAIMIDSTGTYLYAANRSSANISGYSIASGAFTALSGSPYSSGLSATALVEDNTDKYVIAAASNGSYDYTLYSFDALTAGKLDAVSVGASGSDPAGSIAVAATH